MPFSAGDILLRVSKKAGGALARFDAPSLGSAPQDPVAGARRAS